MAYINNVKRHSLHLQIDLPATAPEGHPHIIDDIENISEDDLPDNLEAVDVIATVLYKWNPEALHNLLDMSKNQFHFGYLDARRNEIYLYFYIARDGPEVRVGRQVIQDNMFG
jgi:hypothetical protein